MSVVLNHPINGMAATSVDPDYVVFPAAQAITIDSADDSITIGDPEGDLADVTPANALKVDGSAVTQPVSAASLPLPSGAATSANQVTANTSLASIDAKLTNPLPISGTVTANAGTNLNTSLLALDSTVAKDSSLTTINTSVNTLLKPASTLAAVTTLGTITNVVHVDDNAGSLTVDNATASNFNAQVVGNVGSGAADSGNPVKVGGKFNSTLPTLSDGNRGDVQLTSLGELASRPRNKFRNLTGISTTTLKSGAGVLGGVFFNNGSTSSVITIYDNTAASGTIILKPQPGGTGVFGTGFVCNAEFSTGLTVAITNAASTDITVFYQ